MKKLIITGIAAMVIGTLALPGISHAVPQAQENTGCGLGAMLIGDKGNDYLLGQLAMTFLNGFSSNGTFGITSGTSNCAKPSRVVQNEKLNNFVAANMDSLAQDIASGKGESLNTVAELMNVPAEKRATTFASLQTNFAKIYTSDKVQSADVIDNITTVLAN